MRIDDLYTIYWPKWSGDAIPFFVITCIIILCILGGMIYSRKYSIMQMILSTVLACYLFLVLASTVFTRTPTLYYDYELELFWSYPIAFLENNRIMALEIFLNILMLIPIGILFPLISRAEEKKKFFQTIRWGFLSSVLIEVLQLLLKRGLFEFDDMLNNTLGVVAGYVVYWCIRKIKKIIFRE